MPKVPSPEFYLLLYTTAWREATRKKSERVWQHGGFSCTGCDPRFLLTRTFDAHTHTHTQSWHTHTHTHTHIQTHRVDTHLTHIWQRTHKLTPPTHTHDTHDTLSHTQTHTHTHTHTLLHTHDRETGLSNGILMQWERNRVSKFQHQNRTNTHTHTHTHTYMYTVYYTRVAIFQWWLQKNKENWAPTYFMTFSNMQKWFAR